MQSKDELFDRLRALGQEHLVAFWSQLGEGSRNQLAAQIEAIDLARVQRFVHEQTAGTDWADLARRAKSPQAIRRDGRGNPFSAEAARARGQQALAQGKVGMILVAGGQGTRLGWPHPKGMFPIGPVSGRTLFQVIVDHLKAVSRRSGVSIPLYLMTSPATHDETMAYFESHDWLGMDPGDVHFFCQAMLPAVDSQTGKLLLAGPDSLALSPDGHGGMLSALVASGCLESAARRGIGTFFYGQVDNPLLQVCGADFLGYHLLAGSEVTTQVIPKRFPQERVGNVVEIDGKTQIIEYSDLPAEQAERLNPDGSLLFWAGSMAVHAFQLDFLAREASDADAMPIHRALKKVPFLNADGELVEPSSPNAVKFERFIFDLLPRASRALVVEMEASTAFAPVKNASHEAVDTPETAKAAMIARDSALLSAAGATIADRVAVEVNPLWAETPDEAAAKLLPGMRITGPTYFA